MPIKSKDGNVYRLREPNKLTRSQVAINKDKLIFHNCDWEEICFVDGKPLVQEPPPPTKSEQVNFSPIELGCKAELQPDPTPEPEPPEAQAPDQDAEFPQLNVKTMFHCLPAYTTNHADSFYGSSWQRTKYREKFIFPGVMIEKHDLAITFWTSDPKRQITEQSVVFPFAYEIWNKMTKRYDRVPYDEYRWWRVSQIEEKDGGWIFLASPSDFQPDFSDSEST